MSTETIKEFLVGLGFKVDEAGLGAFTGAIEAATLGAVALGAAVTAAAGVILHDVKTVAEEYDALDKLATRFRTTVDAIDEFNDIGQVLGLTNEQTEGSLKNLDKAIGDTALGLGRAKLVFEEIGLEVLDAGGKMKPTTEVMEELATILKGMERGKALAVMNRLGLDPALLKIFNADLEGLRAELEAIDKAAGFDLHDAVAQSKAFMGAWRGMQVEWRKSQLVFEKLRETIAIRLMPRLSEAVKMVGQQIAVARKYIMDNFEGIRKVISSGLDFILRVFSTFWVALSRVVQILAATFKVILDAFNAINPTVLTATAAVLGFIAAWRLVNASILATPLGQLLALGATLVLLAEDFATWREGGDSLVDWSSWESGIQLVIDIFGALRDTLQGFFVYLFESMDSASDILSHFLSLMLALALNIIAVFSGDFKGAFEQVKNMVSEVISIFQTLFGWIGKTVDALGNFFGVSGSLSKKTGDFLGGINGPMRMADTGGFDMSAVLGPTEQAALGGANQTVTQKTEINVSGAGSPEATARAVGSEQDRVNADMTRNLAARAR